MADLSAISALSSLNERDLYYQYLINNNSTSTMLNALSGNYSDDSGSDFSGIMSAISSAYSSSGLSSVLGSSLGMLGSINSGDIGSLGALTSFSDILKLYMNTQTSEAAGMAEKLSDAMQKAEEQGEQDTSSYKTVQEIYEFFKEKSTMAAAALGSNTTASSANVSSVNAAVSAPVQMATEQMTEFDFDAFESDMDNSISASMVATGISMI